MKKHILITSLFTAIISLGVITTSCRKKADTIARITVRDTANMVVVGAQVILYGKSTTDPIQSVKLRDTAITNTSGIATFNFNETYQLGQAGVAVLDIRASKDGMVGEGIIKIDEEEENTATVFVQP